MSKVNVLALDVATKCGWCTETAHGMWDLSIKKDESSGMRLIRFKSKLVEIVKLEEITLITFERTAGHHKNALIVQAELHGVLKIFCEERSIDYRAFSAKEIKSHATGNGNASKLLMIKSAQEKLGLKTEDDNEADAMWIYNLTKSLY